MIVMKNPVACAAVLTGLVACAIDDEPEVSTTEQAGINMQGINMQGINMQGINMQGINMQGMFMVGFQFSGATLNGPIDLRVERGELIGQRGAVTLRGTALTGARLYAQARDATQTAVAEYRIRAVQSELSSYDPTHTGNTYLYTLDQWVHDTSSWQPACPADSDGRRVAIPLTGTFDESGDRIESTTLFTFGCTTGVIAKCYRWGYRPWVTGYGDLVDMHWTCTRLARGDYCGNGTSNTHEGTVINVWDTLPAPGPIQRHGLLPPLGMLFEAGWNSQGAVCLSRARWILDNTLANACPDRLVPLGLLGETVCDTVVEVLGYDSDAKLFNESYLNLL